MNEVVLVTGASSGIGRELALCFAESGSDLILTARSQDKLEALASELKSKYDVETNVIVEDLAAPEGTAKLVRHLASNELRIDVLVNNAGFGSLGRFENLPLDRQTDMIRLNILALTELTHQLLPRMIQQNSGGILNVGSTASFQPGPNMAVYYATKAYVLSFTEALHEELAATNLSVTCLCPGPTKTGFADEADLGDTILFKNNAMAVEKVAKAGYEAFRANQAFRIPGLKNNVVAFLTRLVPRSLTRKLVKRLQPIGEDD